MLRKLPTTSDLAQRIQTTEMEMWTTWIQQLQKLPENPFGVEIQSFGNATAFLARKTESPPLNRVMGISSGDEKIIEEVISFYHKFEKPCLLELSPYQMNEALMQCLMEKNFLYAGCYEVQMYLLPEFRIESSPNEITIREVVEAEKDIWVRIQVQCFAESFRLSEEQAKVVFESLYDHPRLHAYLAWIKGEAVAAGGLGFQDKVAMLGGGATLPSMRNRGCQTALLSRRIQEAWRFGCELVITQAGPNTPSLRNIERLGMRKAYDKVAVFRDSK